MLRVTVDTNAIGEWDRERMRSACATADHEVEFAHTSVTDREIEGTDVAAPPATLAETGVYDESTYDSGAVYAEPLVETGVWNESRWGEFRWGSIPETFAIGESRLGQGALGEDVSPSRFEAILAAISNGSFPPHGERDTLTHGERRQLRDAMILETHARERRDVFVTNDERGFIRHGKREALQGICGTRIMTVDEFCEFLAP